VARLPGTSAAFSPTADELVIGRDELSSVYTSPPLANAEKLVAKLPKGSGLQVARFDSTGKRIVYADYNHGTIAVEDLRSGRTTRLEGGPKLVWDVRVAPDGQHVAAATATGKVYIWRLDRPKAPERSLDAVSYGPSGRIITAGTDRTVRVWNPARRTEVILRGHKDEVFDAVFTPNGAQALSASADGTLRLWDPSSGGQLAVLQSGGGPLLEVAVSRRDGRIATLSSAGIIRIFNCEVCGSLDQVRAIARARIQAAGVATVP
jgi:WD40 repeat protein